MTVNIVQCGYYGGETCECPSRRLKWYNPERWVLGPKPCCVYDDQAVWVKFEGECKYQIPKEGGDAP